MGIWGLQTFVNERRWYDVVNIKDVADEWRRTNHVEPVIAVDGPCCARHLYEMADKICGGQYKQFREKCRTFVEKFRDSGIRLVFFFDGLPVEEKIDRWVERKKDKLREISQLFADFRARSLSKINKEYVVFIPEAVVPSARVIFGLELRCEMHVATRDCDWELAEYAARSDCCLGVLSNDTDLLAHDGVPCLFTLKHLEMDDRLEARRYNPTEIASKLELRREDLPVFATFVGNDVIRRPQLKSLHKKLKSRYGLGHILENVARFVREGPPENVEALCACAFNSHPNHLENEVKGSIESYRRGIAVTDEPTGGDEWAEVLRLAEERHLTCKMPAVVYAVMKRRRFRIGEVLEDLAVRREDSPPTGLVLRPMRTRLYGVLLNEQGPAAGVTELVPTGIDSIPETPVTAARLPRDVSHPGLRALWQQKDAAVEDQRWRLFGWVTSPRASVSALRSLSPPHLVVPAVALSYLRHCCDPPLLREEEAAVFAAVAVAVGAASAYHLSGPVLKVVDARAVYLATLFVRTVLHVLDATAACGLSFPCEKDCLPDAYFDGRFFHDVYTSAVSQSSSDREEHLDDPRYYLHWCASYEEQFQKLVAAIEIDPTPVPAAAP